jgi:hypothetical protein
MRFRAGQRRAFVAGAVQAWLIMQQHQLFARKKNLQHQLFARKKNLQRCKFEVFGPTGILTCILLLTWAHWHPHMYPPPHMGPLASSRVSSFSHGPTGILTCILLLTLRLGLRFQLEDVVEVAPDGALCRRQRTQFSLARSRIIVSSGHFRNQRMAPGPHAHKFPNESKFSGLRLLKRHQRPLVCVSDFVGQCVCVCLFYVIDTGSTGSQGRIWGLPVYLYSTLWGIACLPLLHCLSTFGLYSTLYFPLRPQLSSSL